MYKYLELPCLLLSQARFCGHFSRQKAPRHQCGQKGVALMLKKYCCDNKRALLHIGMHQQSTTLPKTP
ncbi:hypothetical protein DPMN_166623 [Dreissena polymorpha]|uniref:Uncharacterized protein n=1 Tax=Dreissena polymorpha TaxID=45954 RepID=A0A9D4IXJ8_DREPO|nr:hypothetical protein DPMN_166623 [Dreissena polymorpha]